MPSGTALVGMDVHKLTFHVAVLEAGKPAPNEGVLENGRRRWQRSPTR